MSAIITLTTDFGTQDGFVGQMKGVILGINPDAVLVDITHSIEPYSILEAALVLKAIADRFPLGTIHTAVVDPGVGSDRRPVVLAASGRFFVGPDNGLFSLVMGAAETWEMRRIENEDYMLPNPHPTFHGRDIFAPAAAHLSLGEGFDDLGDPVKDPVSLPIPAPVVTDRGIRGEIIHVDRFGTVVSNIHEGMIERPVESVIIGDIRIQGISTYFGEVPEACNVALINSLGFLEIAVNRGSAVKALGVGRGTKVEVQWKEEVGR